MQEPAVEESSFLCLVPCSGDRLLVEQELETLLSPSHASHGPAWSHA